MIASWKRFESPWFSLEFPPEWTPETSGNHLLLRNASGMMQLSFRPVPARELGKTVQDLGQSDTAPAQEAQHLLDDWLRKQGQLRIREPLHPVGHTRYATCTAEALEQASVDESWWKRLLHRAPVLLARYWAVLSPQVLVLASCRGVPEEVDRRRGEVDAIVSSLVLSDRLVLSGRSFLEVVVKLVQREFPTAAVAAIDDHHLRFLGYPVDLSDLHRHYLQAPDKLPEEVRTFFTQVQRVHALENLPRMPWAEAQGRVLPILVQQSQLHQLGPQTAAQEWVNDLSIVYATDPGDMNQRLRLLDLDRWGMEIEAVHEQSLENLAERSHELVMEGGRAEGYTMLAISQPDPCNAARILLPDLHSKLKPYLGATFYAGIPNREFLLAFSSADPTILSRVRRQIESDHRHMPHPLSDKFFLMTPDGTAGDPQVGDDTSSE